MRENRILAFFVVVAVAALVISTAVQAQQANRQPAQKQAPLSGYWGRFFVDADGDGVCDNLGMRIGRGGGWRGLAQSQIQQSSGGSQTSAQTGTTSWFSTGRGFGRFFIDRDGDGVCDNLGMRIGRNSRAVIGGGRGLRGGRNRRGL